MDRGEEGRCGMGARQALLGVSLCCFLGAKAQGFNRRFDAFGQGFAQGSFGLEQSDSGWVIFSGSYEPDTIAADSILGSYRYVFTYIDEVGDVVSEKRFIHTGHSTFLGWADCCDSIPGGGFVIGGGSTTYGTNLDEARLVRFNAQGDSLWSHTFGSPGAYWIGQQVKHSSDGGFLICGNTDAVSYQDAFAIKTDSDGNEQWRHTYGAGGMVTEAFSAVVELSDGYLLTGRSRPQADDGDMYVVRVNMAGDEIWTQEWGGIYDDAQVHSYLCAEGSVLLAGAMAMQMTVRTQRLTWLNWIRPMVRSFGRTIMESQGSARCSSPPKNVPTRTS